MAGDRNGKPAAFGEAKTVAGLAAAPELDRGAGIADDSAHHIKSDTRKGGGCDTAFNSDDIHLLRHMSQHRGGEHREAADAGKDEDPSGPCLCIKRMAIN